MTPFSLSLEVDHRGHIKPYVKRDEWCILTSFLCGLWVGCDGYSLDYVRWMGDGAAARKYIESWIPTEVAH
jgi:hypothetical protein